jgi:uncharacterized Zn finger protein
MIEHECPCCGAEELAVLQDLGTRVLTLCLDCDEELTLYL